MDTAVLRFQFDPSPLMAILLITGRRNADLSFRKAGEGVTVTVQSVCGIVVVVIGTVVVVVIGDEIMVKEASQFSGGLATL